MGNAVTIAITDVLVVNWPQIIRDRPKVSRKPGFPCYVDEPGVKSSKAKTWKPDEHRLWRWEGFTCCWSASWRWRPPWSPVRRGDRATGEWTRSPAFPDLSQPCFGKNCWRRRKKEGDQLTGCWKRGQGFSMDLRGEKARWQKGSIQETMEWRVISFLTPEQGNRIVHNQMQCLFGKGWI